MRRGFVRNDGKPHQSHGCSASELNLKFRGAQRLAERLPTARTSVCVAGCCARTRVKEVGGLDSLGLLGASAMRRRCESRCGGRERRLSRVLGWCGVREAPRLGLGCPVNPRLAGARSSLTRCSEVPQPHPRVVYERGVGAAELGLRLEAGARPAAPQVQLLRTEGRLKTSVCGFTFLKVVKF